jgi:cysteinyl-tRNA synthetase
MLKLYNTLTKKVEEFVPRDPKLVTLYCCGPTVYDYAHIGNFRTYMMTDLLVRTLKYLNFNVKFAMNITDVGHLTSDADSGIDKMEKGALREGKTAWDIANYYTEAFILDSNKLNLLTPDERPHATAYIKEQIGMVQTLLKKGYAYTIDDGIYFDTGKFKTYGQLTGQHIEELKAGARVEPNPQKNNPTDFALWKFSYPKGRSLRQMEWDSPWGIGFPGWHIECSAMSRTVLHTDQLDIHTGGADLIPVHHTNEIAQSEAATGVSPFVRFWVHGQFIMVDGEKMSKSKGNFYKLSDIEQKGFDPLALRYLYMTAHYRTYLNFTWKGITAAQNSLTQLRQLMTSLPIVHKALKIPDKFQQKFQQALSDDLNLPRALAVVWEVAKATIEPAEKYTLLLEFDRVLGLGFDRVENKDETISDDIHELINKREALRKEKKFTEADAVRKELEKKGYILEDTPQGIRVKKNAEPLR